MYDTGLVTRDPRSLLSLLGPFRGFPKSAKMEEHTKVGILPISHVFSEFGISYFHSVDLASTTAKPQNHCSAYAQACLCMAYAMYCAYAHRISSAEFLHFKTMQSYAMPHPNSPFPHFSSPGFPPDLSTVLICTPGTRLGVSEVVPYFQGLNKYCFVQCLRQGDNQYIRI